MIRKAVPGIMLTLLFISMLTLTFNIQPVKASGTIYITADGSVEGTTDISSVDNVTYYFTDNIYDEIVVERSNVAIDGNGYMLQGPGSGIGFYLSDINNVTIMQTTVKGFADGVYLRESSNNSIFENNIMNNENGILILHYSSMNNSVYGNNLKNNTGNGILLVSSSYNNISDNYLADNRYGIELSTSDSNCVAGNNLINNTYGIGLVYSSDNIFYHNNFIKGEGGQVYDPNIPKSINVWDDGYPSGGNYWSDYSGVDLCTGPYQNLTEGIGSDGIGDTNYAIDGNNIDRYPLTIPWINQTPIHPLEGQYANYTVLSIIHGSIMDSLHWNLTYHKYVSPFLIYLEIWSSGSSWTDCTWTALNITNRYAKHFGWPITGIVSDLWFPGLIETDITIGSTVNLLNGTATVVNSEILRIESRSVDCWRLTHDEEIGPSMYVHHTFWFHKTTGLLIGEEVEASSYQKFNITLAQSNILPDYEIVAAYGSTPTVDGMIDIYEWSDAASLFFNNTEVLIKQDGANLYIALNVTDAPLMHIEKDCVQILLDVDFDGSLTLQPDDVGLVLLRNGTLLEANVTGGTWAITEVSGWTAMVNSTSDMWQVELNITYSKINVVAGVEKTIGVSVGCALYPEEGSPTWVCWPPNTYSDMTWNPSSWGTITSTGYNWIPEFPSLPILLFMLATLLAVILYRRKHTC